MKKLLPVSKRPVRLPDVAPRPVLLALLSAVALLSAPLCRAQQTLTPELLWLFGRVSEPSVSPSGTQFVYGITTYDVEANTGDTDLYLLGTDGGEPLHLTSLPGKESGAQWRPDGEKIGFLWTQDGIAQLWEVSTDGTGLRQVTDIEGGIANFRYAPTGTYISFTRNVRLDEPLTTRYPDLPRADARIIDNLMYRHWDSWHDGTYSHLFVAPYDDGVLGTRTDVMAQEPYDTPLAPHGGVQQVAWSPDGRRLAYTSKKLHGTPAATSTNADIYLYDLASGRTTNLTRGMLGYDLDPAFSPDGRYIAWLSMERDGYEADRQRVFVYDFHRNIKREITVGFDQNAHNLAWSGDSKQLFFTSEARGTVQAYSAAVRPGTIRQLTSGVYNYGPFGVADTEDGTYLVAMRTSMSAPAELYRIHAGTGEAAPLTFTNRDLLGKLKMGKVEKRIVKATDGADILTWVIYPPDFDPDRVYPALLYCQGGPQSAVSQSFSYRWNLQLMAAQGYIVIAPNRRGLPGFGQDWNEQISGDWGGQAMRDLLSAADDVAREPYVDAARLGAVGASFGGYSVYWLAGHHEGRFSTFVAHAGAFNLESKYGTTEELFFANFEMEGPYWLSPRPKSYDAFSPHKFAGRWDTPMLVIHGEKDFRVPVTEGMQAFTALQLQGIPSRFLYFPNEGHWVLEPQNGILWHRVFFEWLGRYLKG